MNSEALPSKLFNIYVYVSNYDIVALVHNMYKYICMPIYVILYLL